MQCSPSPLLSGMVKHYLIVEAERAPSLNYRLFSDGNPGIVFHFGDPLMQTASGSVPHSWLQPRSFLYGQITRYNDWLSGGKLGMLVVVLQPTGLSSLLGMPANELNDSMVKLVDLFGQEALDLEEQVMSACQPGPVAGNPFGPTFYRLHPAIQYVEQFLLKRVATSLVPDPFVSKALQVMVDARGMLKMEDLLRKIPVTERQLERKFKTAVGMGPKKIADIIKFQHFLKLLQQHPAVGNLTDVIYEGGYYDQAHLNNYFKKIVGLTPRQYKANPHLLAVNFMQVPNN